jgi:hypothetical protein
MQRLSVSTKVYLGLIVSLVILRLILTFTPIDFRVSAQAIAFTWVALVIVALLGFIGVWLSRQTGFPEIWDPEVTNRQRLLIPALLGLGSGILLVLVVNQAQLSGQMSVPFPTSIPFYAYGAIASEIPYRLFLIPLPIWLISSLLLKGRFQESVFWGAAVVFSLLEPLGQMGTVGQTGTLDNTTSLMIGSLFALIYGVNLLCAYLFRKSGFLAPLTLRLSLYLVWYIIFPQ